MFNQGNPNPGTLLNFSCGTEVLWAEAWYRRKGCLPHCEGAPRRAYTTRCTRRRLFANSGSTAPGGCARSATGTRCASSRRTTPGSCACLTARAANLRSRTRLSHTSHLRQGCCHSATGNRGRIPHRPRTGSQSRERSGAADARLQSGGQAIWTSHVGPLRPRLQRPLV